MYYTYRCDNMECKWYGADRLVNRIHIFISLGNDLFYYRTPICICGHLCREIK